MKKRQNHNFETFDDCKIKGNAMELVESYITDDRGKIKSVILNYQKYKKFEEMLLDVGLAKAMEEVKDDEEVDLQEAKKISGF